jgi:hypothetical protein
MKTFFSPRVSLINNLKGETSTSRNGLHDKGSITMSHRNFKDRQTRHLNWIIQLVLAEQRLREDTELAYTALSTQCETLEASLPSDKEEEVSK